MPFLLAIALGGSRVSAQSIAFVQVNSAVPQSPQTAVSVPYGSVQTAGNLNVVVVGWNDAVAHVQSLVDSKGNTYALAVGPTVRSGFGSQAIYYGKNIQAAAAGTNVVTVTFDRAASFVDLRIAEYRGLDTSNPLDVTAAAQGSSTSTNSGSVTTRSANELLIGANLVATHTTGPGASYTQRIITVQDGDILEDRVVTAIGSYNALAPISPSGAWIMQMVTFKAAAAGPPDTQAPTAPANVVASASSGTQINVSWTASTDNVGVTGYLIERCQGTGCTTFAQVGTATSATFSNTGLTNGTSYSYRVRATDAANNLSAYSATATATTTDTAAPTAPSALTATGASPTQINLSWTASTDNVAVASYLIERCQGSSCSSFAQVGTSATAGFSDAGLTASTTYRYRVRANDAAGNLSGYSNTADGTTSATQDTQAPTAPATLAASAASGTQINLSWTASTDNVAVTSYLIERCQGVGCSSFAQVGTATGTTFSNSSLTPATSYSFRVRATDAAGNFSGYSNTAAATTQTIPDSDPPSAPAGLSAIASSTSQIDLSWSAATDNVGIATYQIEQCVGAGCSTFAQVGSTAATTFSSVGLTGSTSYSYRVRAADAAGNQGSYSDVATATTQTAPVGITLVQHASKDAGTTTSSALAFPSNNAAGNWIGVAVRAGQAGQTIIVTDTRGNSYRKAAQLNETVDGTTLAFYYAENVSAGSNSVTVADSIAGGTLRFAIFEYSGVATASSFDVSGTAQGTSAAPGSGSVTTTTAGDLVIGMISTANAATFTAGSGYTIEDRVPAAPNAKLMVEDRRAPTPGPVTAAATLGSSDSWGALLAAFKPASGDTTAPTAPGNLAAAALSDSQINLSWTAATDDIAVTSYLVERCAGVNCSAFAQIATNSSTAFSNTSLLGSTTYRYRVRATDAAGNLGPYSNIATAITPAPPDTQAPTAPSGLNPVVASNTRIDLSWTASTDNIGVTAYLVEQCQGAGCSGFAQVGTTSSPLFSATGLSGSTSYSFRVRATDAAGNVSAYSPTGSATTSASPDTQAPTAPTALTATAASSSQIDLSWNPSTDDVGVVSYLIERCQGASCAAFTQIASVSGTSFSSAGLTSSTTYRYQVRATDAAGNLGPYSSPVTAATPAATDTQPPTAPTALTAAVVSTTQLELGWTASTDDVGVTSYLIERCQGAGCATFVQIGSVTSPGFSDAGLVASTIYRYRIRANDAAANLSAYSNTATATTATPPDTQAPTAPTNLTASAVTSGQVNLTWTASTDDVGVTNYQVERCVGAACSTFTQVGATSALSFINTGLTGATTYGYRVRAADAATNLSSYSNTTTVTTPAIAAVAFVQSNYSAPQSSPRTVTVKYGSAQGAGNLNVVVVGWNSATGTVSSVTDSWEHA